MYCIGLTGAIGSGKTTALHYFSELGITTLSADLIAREITHSNAEVLEAIRDYFGDPVFLPSGELNRRALRTIVFSNPKKRQWLEKLLHPLIRQRIQDEILKVTTPYCVIEIPLLFNKQDFPYLNRVLLITTDQTISLKRIMQRDQCSQSDALSILEIQAHEDIRTQIAYDIITNNQDEKTLRNAIEQLDKQYRLYLKHDF